MCCGSYVMRITDAHVLACKRRGSSVGVVIRAARVAQHAASAPAIVFSVVSTAMRTCSNLKARVVAPLVGIEKPRRAVSSLLRESGRSRGMTGRCSVTLKPLGTVSPHAWASTVVEFPQPASQSKDAEPLCMCAALRGHASRNCDGRIRSSDVRCEQILQV